jgi:anion-transporting  ArsA/GET3 family ATPase
MDAMSLTIYELQDKLKEIDELSLLEILNIDSEEIVEKFVDKIEEKYETLVRSFEDENDETVEW